ncbi:hypothetical protein [Nocardia arthritidis]|uniref:Uncharacterized protein n=1 Tax=Nocardia arthritidis TaxID=228602 RepID=A0A6G9YRH0_9NOCA|nr:hypothetical protein [Nocardia arthritidis]QIS15909.1 hypothetical protein F5544_40465 [Nocardia arthritidis]
MKTISRIAAGVLLTAAALLSAAPAQADTGSSGSGPAVPQPNPNPSRGASSATGSCSGSVDRPFRNGGYFYARTYQWASPDFDGNVGTWENHDFSFMGFLDGAEKSRMLGARDGKWIIYRASDFDLAVPYVSGSGLYLLENTDRWGNRDSRYSDLDDRNGNFDWKKLCDY